MPIEQLVGLDDRQEPHRPSAGARQTARSRTARDPRLEARARRTPRRSRSWTSTSVISRFSTSARKNGHSAYSRRSQASRSAFEAVRMERGAAAVPGREQAAVLRPREHPRDRPERLELSGRRSLRARRGTRADLEQRQLVDGRNAPEERREERVIPDEPSVRGLRDRRELVHRVSGSGIRRLEPDDVGKRWSGGWRRRRPRRFARRARAART